MLTVKLILERLDKEGRLLERREQRSRSFAKGFLELLYIAHAQISYTARYTMTDIDGNGREVDNFNESYSKLWLSTLKIGSPPGGGDAILAGRAVNETFILPGQKIGIQVGTGATAVTPTDTALETRIAHGRSAGELEYGGCELIGIAFADPNGEFTIRRYFTNASGGSITVNEVGIYSIATANFTATTGAWPFLIARDLTGGVAVADTEILRATYVPQIMV
ncbi:hypothetical protein ES703_109181 [subsurface metagenome]